MPYNLIQRYHRIGQYCCLSHIKHRLMHTFTINPTLLTLCHSAMFQPSKGHLQGVRLIHFKNKVNMKSYRCKIQLSKLRAIYGVIRNDCWGFNNLSYTIHFREEYVYFLFNRTTLQVFVTYLFPPSIPEIKVRIRTAIETITADMLQTWEDSIIMLMFVESQRVHM